LRFDATVLATIRESYSLLFFTAKILVFNST
jgi:hypothetical protein